MFYKLLRDKMNMYLHLSETTLKTILGTVLKNEIENFSVYTIFSLFTTHIYICYQFILKHLYTGFFNFCHVLVFFRVYSEFALNLSIPLVEVLQISFCHTQNVFCTMYPHLVKIII